MGIYTFGTLVYFDNNIIKKKVQNIYTYFYL